MRDLTSVVVFSLGIAVLGFLYRHFRTKALPAVSNAEFVAEFLADYPIGAAPAEILTERKRISKVLGIPEEKLSPRQSPEFLSRQLSSFGSFGVGWTDLMYDLTKARETCGLDLLDAEPSTIGELIRELISVREGLPESSRSRARVESIP